MQSSRALQKLLRIIPNRGAGRPSKQERLTTDKTMNTKRWMVGLIMAGSAAMVTGCAERRGGFVSVYSAPPGYAYSTASGYPAAPLTAQPGVTPGGTTPPPAATGVAPQTAVTAAAPTAPPAPAGETVPMAPGPDYVWAPGYWGWNGGAWVWVGGNWMVRPALGVVWVGGHWTRHGRGYYWVGGHWH